MTKRFYQETFMTDETHEEQQQQHISLINRPIVKCRNLVSRFEALRLQLSSVQYYDPFQREQQNEEINKLNNSDDDDDSYCVIERPAKRQRSFVSTVVDSVVNGLLYSAASVYEYVWAQPQSIDEKYREKINAHQIRQISKTSKKQTPKMRGQGIDYNFSQQPNHTFFFNLRQDEQPIRDIFLRTQRAALSKCNNKKIMNNYTMINDARRVEENWGLVDKENYGVDFLPTLPGKPPRHVPVKSLGLFGNQVPSLGFNINNNNNN